MENTKKIPSEQGYCTFGDETEFKSLVCVHKIFHNYLESGDKAKISRFITNFNRCCVEFQKIENVEFRTYVFQMYKKDISEKINAIPKNRGWLKGEYFIDSETKIFFTHLRNFVMGKLKKLISNK